MNLIGVMIPASGPWTPVWAIPFRRARGPEVAAIFSIISVVLSIIPGLAGLTYISSGLVAGFPQFRAAACALRRGSRRFSDAVATMREGHRTPRSDPANRRRSPDVPDRR